MKSLKIVLVTISLILITVALLSIGKGVSATAAPTGLGVNGLNSQGTATLNATNTANTATPSLTNLQNKAVTTTTATNSVPQTGDSEDFIIYGLIAVFIVVGIFAYKKVRDYNI